jgi:hypothetical protein
MARSASEPGSVPHSDSRSETPIQSPNLSTSRPHSPHDRPLSDPVSGPFPAPRLAWLALSPASAVPFSRCRVGGVGGYVVGFLNLEFFDLNAFCVFFSEFENSWTFFGLENGY